MSSAHLVTMGALEPSCHLLFLPVFLTVGGELGASAAVCCVFSSGWGQGWAESRKEQDRTTKGEGWEEEEGSSSTCGSLPELEAPRFGTWQEQ